MPESADVIEGHNPNDMIPNATNNGGSSPDTSKDENNDETDYATLTKYLPLIRATVLKEWKTVLTYLQKNSGARTDKLQYGNNNTFLEMVVGYCKEADTLRKIANLYTKDDLDKTDVVNLLEIICCFGNVAAAKIFLPRIQLTSTGVFESEENHPVAWAAFYGNQELVALLLHYTKYIDDPSLDDNKVITRFTKLVEGDFFEPALKLLSKHRRVACKAIQIEDKDKDQNSINCLSCLAKKREAFQMGDDVRFLDKLIYFSNLVTSNYAWIPCLTYLKRIRNLKTKQKQAEEILEIICEGIMKSESSAQLEELVREATLTAAKHGNYRVVAEIIKCYPPALYLHKKGKGLFHFAVEHRHAKLCSLLYLLGPVEKGLLDGDSNDIMHYAAKLPPYSSKLKESSPILRMQQEMQWFQAMESFNIKIVYAYGKEKQTNKESSAAGQSEVQEKEKEGEKSEGVKTEDKNTTVEDESSESESDEEKFSNEHENLKQEAEKTIKDIAQSGTVVAALITTVAFAAAFTLPGGNNETSGTPIYLGRTSFMVFAISDALAFFCSTISVLVFTFLLTSPFAQKDFAKSLPLMLICGLVFLSFSAAFLMVAFCAGLHLVLSPVNNFIIIPFSLIASFPVAMFISLQLPFLLQLLKTSLGKAHLPTPDKAHLHTTARVSPPREAEETHPIGKV